MVRALVVDDSRAMRMMLGRELSQLGFEVFEAGDGQEALARLAELGPVDVALVDWTMPVMDGVAFLKKVRAVPEYERIRVIIVTSESDPAQIMHALMAGADEYATKPITAAGLAEKLGLVGFAKTD
jgi:two-component system, chemotaxis family, chemotaxis protein CheY